MQPKAPEGLFKLVTTKERMEADAFQLSSRKRHRKNTVLLPVYGTSPATVKMAGRENRSSIVLTCNRTQLSDNSQWKTSIITQGKPSRKLILYVIISAYTRKNVHDSGIYGKKMV